MTSPHADLLCPELSANWQLLQSIVVLCYVASMACYLSVICQFFVFRHQVFDDPFVLFLICRQLGHLQQGSCMMMQQAIMKLGAYQRHGLCAVLIQLQAVA